MRCLSLVSLGAALVFAAQAVSRRCKRPTWGSVARPAESGRGAARRQPVRPADGLHRRRGHADPFLSPGLGNDRRYNAAQLRRYQIFINLFIAAMLLAVSANNVGVMWIAIEATTIFSAFIIPLKLSKASVEAVVEIHPDRLGRHRPGLCRHGAGLFRFCHLLRAGGERAQLDGTAHIAPTLHPEVMRLAFVFLLVGYGTKAGIAPMHTWQPDAYGEAPAPLDGADVVGALLAVAMYAIMRWKVVADATLGDRLHQQPAHGAGPALAGDRRLQRGAGNQLQTHAGLFEHRTHRADLPRPGAGAAGHLCRLLHLVNHTAAKSLHVLPGR